MEHFPLLVEQATAAAGQHTVLSPFDRQPIATVDTANSQHVEQALSNAYRLFRDRDSWLAIDQRIEILEKLAVLIDSHHEHLSLESAREGGKPLLDSRVEVSRGLDGVKLAIEALRKDGGSMPMVNGAAGSRHHLAFTTREPIGVVVAVSAFNHPFNLIIHQVIPAVASGCPVIVKPAGDTPLSCMRIIQMLHQAGLPPAWAQAMVTAETSHATQLVTDSRVGFFSFIGSSKVGWMLKSKLAAGTRCALEHGGVAPVIVHEDADIEQTIQSLAKGGYYHAGQVCVSVQRVYAHKSVFQQLAKGLANAANAMKVGDPTSPTTEVGPLIRPAELERIHSWVEEAVKGGAVLAAGGKAISETCYPPTLLLNPAEDAKVSTEEVFGPVVCLYEFDEMDQAINRANSLPVAFQAAVFGKDMEKILRCYKRLDASAVMVNQHTAFRVDGMPFAGLRQSGIGVGGIEHTIAEMQIEKMMVIRSEQL
ncbi:aldehyde dehydrogenase family protein [Pelagibaculum spongiae]|uniref:Aldehyde dehydrogenase n=1 Tax=Pelagibaculum spongiae TaxID=2080658 RepID=A0A2V1GQD3_9GAMM|nr:aldehyde dehydrogenase family protein [Pelagibaculum spongiae]PVZ65408.1 aldehyde dehydrogenase [Pelagibaculum spongiae]